MQCTQHASSRTASKSKRKDLILPPSLIKKADSKQRQYPAAFSCATPAPARPPHRPSGTKWHRPVPGRGGNSDPTPPRPARAHARPRRGASVSAERASRSPPPLRRAPAGRGAAGSAPHPPLRPLLRRRHLGAPQGDGSAARSSAEPALTALANQRSARGDRLRRASQWRRRRGRAVGCRRPSCGRRRRGEGAGSGRRCG